MPKNLADLLRLLSKTKPWAAIAILFAMILATFYGFQGYRYWEARTEVEAANSQIETISRKLQEQVPNIDASEAELQRQQDLFENYRSVFTYTDMGQIMTIISDTATEAQVDLPILSVGEATPIIREGLRYQTHSLSINVKGETDNIFEFLFQLHQSIPVVQISSVTLNEPYTDTSVAQVVLAFYVSPEAAPESEQDGAS